MRKKLNWFTFLKGMVATIFVGIVFLITDWGSGALMLAWVASLTLLDIYAKQIFLIITQFPGGYKMLKFLRKKKFKFETSIEDSPGFRKTTPRNRDLASAYDADLIIGLEHFSDLVGFEFPFAIYYSGPVSSVTQVEMWLPFLKAILPNTILICREKEPAKYFSSRGYIVVLLSKLRSLEAVENLGVKFVFYVNNGMKNTHLVRYGQFTHVLLLHGESDKPASFNPIAAMYDLICVAGELAISRYEQNGIFIPKDKFRIISRPQVSNVLKQNTTSRTFGQRKTVLYTTTWSGYQEASNFSSIDIAERVVAELVQKNFRVIFQAHPNSFTNSTQTKIIDNIAEHLKERSSESCPHLVTGHRYFGNPFQNNYEVINESDILITDVSGIIGDWIYSEKPFIVIDTFCSKETFREENPLANSGYYTDYTLRGFDKIFEDILIIDSLKQDRSRAVEYVLGVSEDITPIELFTKQLTEMLQNYNKSTATQKLLKLDCSSRDQQTETPADISPPHQRRIGRKVEKKRNSQRSDHTKRVI